MITKLIEVRDRRTCIPALAIRMQPASALEHRYLAECTGYPSDGVVLMRLADQEAHSDPFDWNDRTMHVAHLFLIEHFDEVAPGAVVDIRVVLGEATEPAAAEIWP